MFSGHFVESLIIAEGSQLDHLSLKHWDPITDDAIESMQHCNFRPWQWWLNIINILAYIYIVISTTSLSVYRMS